MCRMNAHVCFECVLNAHLNAYTTLRMTNATERTTVAKEWCELGEGNIASSIGRPTGRNMSKIEP